MKKHIQTVHDGVKYPCDQCEKQFTQQSNLNKHILSPHEGIKYPCGQCTKQFTELGSLKKHMKAIHLKVKYYWLVLLSFKRYIVIFRMSRILCRTPSFDWLWQARRSVFFFNPTKSWDFCSWLFSNLWSQRNEKLSIKRTDAICSG